MSDAALENLKAFWETLSPATVATLERIYTEDAYFRDPFNEVNGAPELRRIFNHMFETLIEPKFTIVESVRQDSSAFLVWNFDFRVKAWKPGITRRIHGSSHIRFAPDGRVSYHRDYWDAGGELYATLPVIGPVIRWLERKMK
ncbi:MAG: nuclear transport factor 2 family protein [Usitatibacter sp.]